jgi:hypothetical protein
MSRSKAAVVETFSDLRMGRAIELEGIDELWSGLEASKTSHFDPK